jgi:hypothetical protein
MSDELLLLLLLKVMLLLKLLLLLIVRGISSISSLIWLLMTLAVQEINWRILHSVSALVMYHLRRRSKGRFQGIKEKRGLLDS